MGRIPKWLALVVVVLIAAATATIAVAGFLYRSPGQELTPSGLPRDASLYLRMRDGTAVAVDVWLPKNLGSNEKIPTLIKGTPYWRAADLTFVGRAASELGAPIAPGEPDVAILNHRGYAVITVDTRGTGASFGHQKIAFDDAEVGDFGEIIDWAARQSWSNGRVGAYGFSYRGILAVSMASLNRPALKAIAPSFDFTDLYLTTHPGGTFSETFLKKWGAQTGELNRGNLPCTGICQWLISGPKRVDADRDGAMLKAAIAEHGRNYDVYLCSKAAADRDSKVCASQKALSAVSEIARQSAVERSGIPIYVIAGYFDGPSPAEVMERFNTFSNLQQIVLGPISHGGFQNTDPFAARSAVVDPSYAQQTAGMADFFDRYLKPDGAPISRLVTFDVLNGGGWRTATEWPPHGAVQTRFYLREDHKLLSQMTGAPQNDTSDVYRVDFSASTGELSRYQSPVDLSRTSYPDRARQDRQLLTYSSAPLESDVTMAGNPLAHLNVASSSPDGEVIVYLEDVRRDGSVVYLTEGILRLVHRKPTSHGSSAPSSDRLHSYLAADETPMTPGKAESVEVQLSPIAVVFRKGERIRVAVAGADAANLARIPASGPATLTIERTAQTPSFVELPMIPADR